MKEGKNSLRDKLKKRARSIIKTAIQYCNEKSQGVQ